MKKKIKLHGECIITTCHLPKQATKIVPSNNHYHIVADSDTTGNHHVVEVGDGVSLYTHEDKIYM